MSGNPENLVLKIGIGTIATTDEQLLYALPPTDFQKMTINDLLHYGVGKEYKGQSQELATGVTRILAEKNWIGRPKYHVEIAGNPANPTDKVEQYLANVALKNGFRSLDIRVSNADGGGLGYTTQTIDYKL